jgi:hypothetical protein
LDRKRRERVAAATADKLEWLLGLAKADLGSLPIADISAGEILRVLQPLEAAGKLETAKRLRSVIGAVFRYAITTARVSGGGRSYSPWSWTWPHDTDKIETGHRRRGAPLSKALRGGVSCD